jgi:hypothetical protein
MEFAQFPCLLLFWGNFSTSEKLRTASQQTSLHFRGQEKHLHSTLQLSRVPGEVVASAGLLCANGKGKRF